MRKDSLRPEGDVAYATEGGRLAGASPTERFSHRSELNINIEDVTQSILQGMFAMIMLVDITHCSVNHEELHKRTDALAKEMGMQIDVTRQEVFDAMHTI